MCTYFCMDVCLCIDEHYLFPKGMPALKSIHIFQVSFNTCPLKPFHDN